jgi:Na+/H+ antiporter NhaC
LVSSVKHSPDLRTQLHIPDSATGSDVPENNADLRCQGIGNQLAYLSALTVNKKRERSKAIRRTFEILLVALICVVTLTAPVAAGAAGFIVTDPGTLIGLGIGLVSVGVGTRKLLRKKRTS